jgi:hypothetical protein
VSATKAKRLLDEYLSYGGFGPVEREHIFHPTRKWRLDWFLPQQGAQGVGIEYDGLMHRGANQGHASISGILRDSDKLNEAQALGIPVYRANAKSIESGQFFTLLDRVLRSDQ